MKILYEHDFTLIDGEEMSLAPGQINLPFQIAVLIVILAGYVLKRMKKLLYHGITMTVAAFMSLFSFLIVMLPSSFGLIEFVTAYPYSRLSLAFVAHMILGILTGILAAWIVAAWRFRSSVQYCSRRKMTMRVTMVLWLGTLALGIITYLYLYNIV